MNPDRSTEVLVIGGGLAGLSIAYQLARLGIKPLLLEAGALFSGTSGACAGRAQVLDSHPGSYLDLVLSGINCLRTLGEELEFDLEWQEPGHLALIQTPWEWDALAQRVADLRQRGVLAEMVAEAELRRLEPLLETNGLLGAALALEGHLNPFRLCQGLAMAARRLGAQICTHTPVIRFKVEQGKVTKVVTERETCTPQVAILAGGAWTGVLLSKIDVVLPIQFTQAEALITEPLPPRLNHHVGMADFYHAVHGGDCKVAFGVGQHPNGTLFVSNAIQPVPCDEMGLGLARQSSAWGLRALAQALHRLFPSLSSVRVMRTWSAPSPFLPDYLPVIGWASLDGSAPSNLYLAAGFHLAIPTIATLSRWIAAEIVCNQLQPELAPFRPSRWEIAGPG
jgi:sarcosine oxidase subunit beta